MVLRTIGAVFRGNQLSSVTPIESSKYLDLLKTQSQKIGLRKFPSFWSSVCSSTPYAVGVLAPAIVVPLSMLTSLSSSELQAVLAHELAHIKRNDYLANLFQMVIEAVYFFNPAVWWISRQIRVEREACCDQIAIESAGNNIGYATILANWMETVAGSPASTVADAPAAAMAFSNKQPSGMLERIQRILKPESKPRLRVSPMNWVFVIAASILIACVMNVGSKAVTTVAARALSDSERVAKIEEKREQVDEHADGVFEEGVTTIRGRITTEDGGEVEGGWMYSMSVNGGSSSNSTECDFKAGKEFEISVPSGVVWLEFYSKNYAPAIVGPIKALKDDSITQNVALNKGVPHLIHVVDEDGQPVAGAHVYMSPKSHGGPIWKIYTDDQGNYTFKHRTPGVQSSLWVEKIGYIKNRMIVTNNGKTEVVLKTAPVSKGVVLSADGAPVANAEIRLLANRGLFFNRKTIATTDKQGRFETPMFFPTGVYEILVVSDDGMAVFKDVIASEDLKFTLDPACSMDISITGDLEQLRRGKKGKLAIKFVQRVGRSLWNSQLEKGELEIVEDSENQVRVTIKRLLPGPFTLSSGGLNQKFEAKPGNQTAEISASADSGKPANRANVLDLHSAKTVELHLRFACDGKPVKPSGSLRLEYNSFYKLIDGQLKVKVKPGTFRLVPNRMIGFTIVGLRKKIEVKAGEVNEFTVDVQPAGAVSGRLVDENGKPVSATVSCRYNYAHPRGYTSSSLVNDFKSDEDGKFLLTPIPLGAKVTVKAGDRFNPAISDELLIEASNPVIDVRLQTSPPAKATVRVLDHQGNPMPGVDLSISLVGHGGWSGSMITDADGEYEVTPLHPTMDYAVTVDTKKGFVPNTVDLVQGETNILQLEPGCALRGRLLDHQGNPVSERRVFAQAIDGDVTTTHKNHIDADEWTDAQGRFEFTKLPKAEFRIMSFKTKPVIVNAGVDEGPIELRVEK